MSSIKEKRVTFTFALSDRIKKVFLVGDFNRWEVGADPMQRMPDGSFRRTKKLPTGSYEYRFFADGIYWDDPEAREYTSRNSYGTRNAVISVN